MTVKNILAKFTILLILISSKLETITSDSFCQFCKSTVNDTHIKIQFISDLPVKQLLTSDHLKKKQLFLEHPVVQYEDALLH